MNTLKLYDDCYCKAFAMDKLDNKESIKVNEIPQWDSVGHMELITLIEETFDLLLDTEDILSFTSYERGIEILKKYSVEL